MIAIFAEVEYNVNQKNCFVQYADHNESVHELYQTHSNVKSVTSLSENFETRSYHECTVELINNFQKLVSNSYQFSVFIKIQV